MGSGKIGPRCRSIDISRNVLYTLKASYWERFRSGELDGFEVQFAAQYAFFYVSDPDKVFMWLNAFCPLRVHNGPTRLRR